MICSKLTAWLAAFAIVLGASHFLPAVAAEGEPAEGSETSSSPKSPIKVGLVDYVAADEGPGTLKLAGTAIPSSDVYIYLDDQPFAHVMAESDGKWSAEDKTDLGDDVHTIRVEQFDETTRMLAGRAQFNISLSKPDAAGEAPGAKP